MIILGVETSTPVSSVALRRDTRTLASATHAETRRHVEFLMPAIRDLLAQATLTVDDLDALAVGIGPGQFTGMRAGIATMKALALALGIPLAGVPTLDVLAWPARDHPGPVCATIDAKRGQIFAAFYRGGTPTGEIMTLDPAELVVEESTLVVGNGAAVPPTFPSAEDVCEIGARRIGSGDTIAAVQIEPLYVRRSDAEINWDARGVTIERPMRVKPAKHIVERAAEERP